MPRNSLSLPWRPRGSISLMYLRKIDNSRSTRIFPSPRGRLIPDKSAGVREEKHIYTRAVKYASVNLIMQVARRNNVKSAILAQ